MAKQDPRTAEQSQSAQELEAEIMANADDSVIGQAFRKSLLAIGVLAALGFGFFYLQRDDEAAAPEVDITLEAPEQVHSDSGDGESTGDAADQGPPQVAFQDIASEAGIDFVQRNGARGDKLLPETMGAGVAVFDYDQDGDQDLFFVNGDDWPETASSDAASESGSEDAFPASEASSVGHALYANDGAGNFTNVSEEAGLNIQEYGVGVAAADYDADGWVDLFISKVGENRLLRNVEGRFEDVTAEAGVAGDAAEWSSSAAFFDYDGDEDLDLFVANYVRWSPEIDFTLDYRLTGVGRAYGPPQNYEGTQPYLYANQGDGRFEDVSAQSGIQLSNPATGSPMAKSLGILPIDADGDGFMDLFVANDTVRNFFFHNQGDGRFEEVAELWGMATIVRVIPRARWASMQHITATMANWASWWPTSPMK